MSEKTPGEHRAPPDWPFVAGLVILGGSYVVLIVAMLLADVAFAAVSARPGAMLAALQGREFRFAVWLSMLSCTLTAILSVWVGVPLGYLLSRYSFPGKRLVDALIDVPIVLPPLVIGLSLLILFRLPPGSWVEQVMPVTYAVPSVILAQFAVAAAFAVRTMRVTFDQISPRREQVALTLGCSRSQAFWWVVLPEAWRGVVTAGTLAWARSLGEFGPILVFSGATRRKTEVLSTTVFLELSSPHGSIEGALAVSLLMVAAALVVLLIVRVFGQAEKWP